jgi:hypothetical protein
MARKRRYMQTKYTASGHGQNVICSGGRTSGQSVADRPVSLNLHGVAGALLMLSAVAA